MTGERTLASVRREAVDALQAAGIEDAPREASLLIRAATGERLHPALSDPEALLTAGEHERITAWLARRARHEPLSRIRGEREFYGRAFEITSGTLDPRPDTETLIDAVLEIADAEGWRSRPVRILDVGTGTGCLLVTLLAELPLALGWGSDVSPAALQVAQRNAARHGIGDRAAWIEARSLDGVPGPFDLVVSNPPYIVSAEIATLEDGVRLYDPSLALDGGLDGLNVYREIAGGLGRAVPQGWIVLEVGAGQAGPVAEIMKESVGGAAGEPRFWTDLGGHTRCVAMRTHF